MVSFHVCSQVAIPVVSVRLVKKHKTAGLVPNGLAITTDTGQKVRGLFMFQCGEKNDKMTAK